MENDKLIIKFRRNVVKIGGSHYIRIPFEIVKKLKVKADSEVILTMRKDDE